MNKFLNIITLIIARGMYVFFGAFVMLMICRASIFSIDNFDNEFILPDLRQVEECLNYKVPDTEFLIGQICHLKNGFVYLYLPAEQHLEYLVTACAIIDKLDEEKDIPHGRKKYF